MSFGFAAIGSRDEIIAQLGLVETDNQIGKDIADLLASHMAAQPDRHHHLGDDWRAVYVVKASGHSGAGSPLSLSVSVEPQHVRVVHHGGDVQDEDVAKAL